MIQITELIAAFEHQERANLAAKAAVRKQLSDEANARCCPRCGGKSIRTSVQQWTAVAEGDPNSSTTLDEHQCGNDDCAISFWC